MLDEPEQEVGNTSLSSSSDDTNINVSNDFRHFIHNRDRHSDSTIIGISTLMPSRVLTSTSEAMTDDEVPNVGTNSNGLRLRSANHNTTISMSGENEIPMNDLSSEIGFRQPSAMSAAATTKFTTNTESRPERSRKVISNSKFDFRQKNRSSFVHVVNGTYPAATDEGKGKVNEGFVDPVIEEEIRSVKRTKEGFFHDVKSKIQKTTKRNRLNKVYSPVLIVNLTEVRKS